MYSDGDFTDQSDKKPLVQDLKNVCIYVCLVYTYIYRIYCMHVHVMYMCVCALHILYIVYTCGLHACVHGDVCILCTYLCVCVCACVHPSMHACTCIHFSVCAYTMPVCITHVIQQLYIAAVHTSQPALETEGWCFLHVMLSARLAACGWYTVCSCMLLSLALQQTQLRALRHRQLD